MRISKFAASLLVCGLLSAASLNASAAAYISATSSGYSFGDSVPNNSFSELLSFSVASPSEISGSVSGSSTGSSFSFTSFKILASDLSTVATGTVVAGGPKFSFAFLDAVGAGNYYLQIVGSKAGTASYSGSLTISAVPEPESMALFMAGLGLIGGIASRKAKKLA